MKMADKKNDRIRRLRARRADLAYMLGPVPDWQIHALAYLIRRLDRLDADIRMQEAVQ